MPGDLPDCYLNICENGAVVFRIDTENRQRRIELEDYHRQRQERHHQTAWR